MIHVWGIELDSLAKSAVAIEAGWRPYCEQRVRGTGVPHNKSWGGVRGRVRTAHFKQGPICNLQIAEKTTLRPRANCQYRQRRNDTTSFNLSYLNFHISPLVRLYLSHIPRSLSI